MNDQINRAAGEDVATPTGDGSAAPVEFLVRCATPENLEKALHRLGREAMQRWSLCEMTVEDFGKSCIHPIQERMSPERVRAWGSFWGFMTSIGILQDYLNFTLTGEAKEADDVFNAMIRQYTSQEVEKLNSRPIEECAV